MIESVHVANEASYGPNPQVLSRLRAVNYIYGANATGKTTISRVVANPERYADSKLVWQGGSPLEVLVYNRDFVAETFGGSKEIKGIFTLGKAEKALIDQISAKKEEVDGLREAITGLRGNLEGSDGLGGKRAERTQQDREFEEQCWQSKVRHEGKLEQAMKGAMRSKKSFRERVLQEHATNKTTLRDLSALENDALTVFGTTPTAEVLVEKPSFQVLTESEANSILAKKIIGKEGIDIAEMIKRLGNSDWVKQGIPYFEPNEDHCPFCQQEAPASLKRSLEEYFDETFNLDSTRTKELLDGYRNSGVAITTKLNVIEQSKPRSLDLEKLQAQTKALDALVAGNVQSLERKFKEPSQTVVLSSVASTVTAINDLLDASNNAITAHNSMVANLGPEQKRLKAEVWRYILDKEIATDLASYSTKTGDTDKAISAIDTQITGKTKDLQEKEAELRALEKETTSIKPTINTINGLLRSFGFGGFKLAEAEVANHYKIVRDNGGDAKETLSEGERSFITFLYFYHLLHGSPSESGTVTDRVVVFDDPVSSLDSDVLFIVSNLIRRLISSVSEGKGHIKQVMMLTHNVYFHKEVSHDTKRDPMGTRHFETFWVVRKMDGVSSVIPYSENPIKTSYQLLWAEVKTPNRLTVRNTLRRILENYFQVLGGYDLPGLVDRFEGEEQVYCGSLVRWLHDGSHLIDDDVYRVITDEEMHKYLEVFRSIFKKMDHEAHYRMMLGEYSSVKSVTAPLAAAAGNSSAI